jgi:DNA-binding MarR family transcriptional regulator
LLLICIDCPFVMTRIMDNGGSGGDAEVEPRSSGSQEERAEHAQGVQLFLKMSNIWELAVPGGLKGKNPRMGAKLLELAEPPQGVSQSSLPNELRLNESVTSRLLARLKKEGWVAIEIPRRDGRLRIIRLTPTARAGLEQLRSDLNGCLNSHGAVENPRKTAASPARKAKRSTQKSGDGTKELPNFFEAFDRAELQRAERERAEAKPAERQRIPAT